MQQKHHIDGDILEAYVSGRLPVAECTLIEEHLIVCAECRARQMGWGEYVRVRDAMAALLNRPRGS
jgi:anti-sigma factor RsiW